MIEICTLRIDHYTVVYVVLQLQGHLEKLKLNKSNICRGVCVTYAN